MFKKMSVLAAVFAIGVYHDKAWDAIKQVVSGFEMIDGLSVNITRLSYLSGMVGITTAILSAIGLLVSTIAWSFARADDDDAKKVAPVLTTVTAGLLALCTIASALWVTSPDGNNSAAPRVVLSDAEFEHRWKEVSGRCVVSPQPDGSFKVVLPE